MKMARALLGTVQNMGMALCKSIGYSDTFPVSIALAFIDWC